MIAGIVDYLRPVILPPPDQLSPSHVLSMDTVVRDVKRPPGTPVPITYMPVRQYSKI